MIALFAALLLAQQGGPRTTPGVSQEKQEIPGEHRDQGCGALPTEDDLRKLLQAAPEEGEVGGMASGRFEWAAIVNRSGEVCAVVVSTDDPTAAWPGSQAIAVAKAYTANAFSTDSVPMSTARLYTMSLPGHSLWSAANSNPLNPECLVKPSDKGSQKGKVCGGTIAFGGGVPLYRS